MKKHFKGPFLEWDVVLFQTAVLVFALAMTLVAFVGAGSQEKLNTLFGVSLIAAGAMIIVITVTHIGNLARLKQASRLIEILFADAEKRGDEIMLRLVKEEATELCRLFQMQNHMLAQTGKKAPGLADKHEMAEAIVRAKKSYWFLREMARISEIDLPTEYQACASLKLSPSTQKIYAAKQSPL